MAAALSECQELIAAAFSGGGDFDVVAFMKGAMEPVDKRIMWKFGPGLSKGRHRLVITAETDRELRPLVDFIVANAPEFPRWEFYGYRWPESVEQVESAIRMMR
jgi:hypothetical protein